MSPPPGSLPELIPSSSVFYCPYLGMTPCITVNQFSVVPARVDLHEIKDCLILCGVAGYHLLSAYYVILTTYIILTTLHNCPQGR